MTSLRIEHSDEWVMADLAADPWEWTRATVRTRAGEEGRGLSEELVGRLADVMLPALESARMGEIPSAMLLFLMPDADVPVICNVAVRCEPVGEEVVLADLVQSLRLPGEMLEQPALEEVIRTSSGDAVHLVQRYRTPVDPTHEVVQEHEAFVWLISGIHGDLAVLLSTSYLDLVQAATWRPKLVELAGSLTLVPDDPA